MEPTIKPSDAELLARLEAAKNSGRDVDNSIKGGLAALTTLSAAVVSGAGLAYYSTLDHQLDIRDIREDSYSVGVSDLEQSENVYCQYTREQVSANAFSIARSVPRYLELEGKVSSREIFLQNGKQEYEIFTFVDSIGKEVPIILGTEDKIYYKIDPSSARGHFFNTTGKDMSTLFSAALSANNQVKIYIPNIRAQIHSSDQACFSKSNSGSIIIQPLAVEVVDALHKDKTSNE